MHEQSLVRALLNHVAAICHEQLATGVTEVRVRIGPLSGAEPLLFSTAFEQLAPASAAAGATLVIEHAPLVVECVSCAQRREMHDFVFRCPTCGGNVNVLSGDAIHLVSVSLRSRETVEEIAS